MDATERTETYTPGGNRILEIIENIIRNKDNILAETDIEETAKNFALFEQLINEFQKHDRRKDEAPEKAALYSELRSNDRNNTVQVLLDMMKAKIDVFEKELSLAEKIQKKLIPAKIPEIPGYDIHAYYHPSRKVGGDYYDFFLGEDKKFYFLIADVSGHGIPSSLVVSSMQAYIYAQVEEKRTISSMVENLNSYLIQTLLAGKFVTMFLGVLNINTGSLDYINAGHNPPCIINSDGEVRELTKGGPILGFFDDITFITGKDMLKDGDLLALYTDGVIEQMNKQEEEFSQERFIQLIINNQNKPLMSITLELFKQLRIFCDGTPYQDDITLMMLKRDCSAGQLTFGEILDGSQTATQKNK